MALAAAAAEGCGVGHARANVTVVSTLNGPGATAAAGTLARAAVGSSVVATSVVLQADVVAVAVDAEAAGYEMVPDHVDGRDLLSTAYCQ